MSNSKWFVLRVEPRCEHLAAQAMQADGIESYLPVRRPGSRRSSDKPMPLFPGYLFVKWDGEFEPFLQFRPIHHAIGWLRFGDVIPEIPVDYLLELSERMNAWESNYDLLGRQLQKGEQVKIESGVFEGLAEVLADGKSSESRVDVLIEFMGRIVQVNLPKDNLTSCSDSSSVNSTAEFGKVRRPRRTRGKRRSINTRKSISLAGTQVS